ncbi:hypothetical protein [Portibacter marinus]|uniref:hypothetical protein n=1 Tax=Portibacter marinus TaxID=2898660 RepID=UPI001F2D5C1B|nr:hypothetical protein [Portibacter marinus]
MTLGDFFNVLSENPSIVIFYFIAVPLSALLGWIFGRGDGHLTPWKYFYCAIIYFACVPGIFAITLSIYQFLFERMSVNEINIYTQILPIISMVLTIWLVKKNVALDQIPGFGKLPALMVIILVLLALMWALDRTRIIAFTGFPFFYVIIILIALFVVIRVAMKRLAR